MTLTPCHELHRRRRTVKLILFDFILIDLQNDTHNDGLGVRVLEMVILTPFLGLF